jgi:sodium/potassium-transporting ATPase subunit alpha
VLTAIVDLDWHLLSVEDICKKFQNSVQQGLSSHDILGLQEQYGRNVLSPPPSRWLIKTLKYLFGGFGSVLLTASILVFIAWKPLGQPPAIANLALAIVLAIVFVIQAMFSFYQGMPCLPLLHLAFVILPS